MIGTFGNAAYSSLNHHKIISTGDGGFVLIRDKTVFEKVMSLHDQGCYTANGKRVIPSPSDFGSSLRVSNIVGAVALAQLTRFFLIKTKVWNCYNQVKSIMNEYYEHEELSVNEGDIPFFYLFKPNGHKSIKLPSLRESGWHSAENIDAFSKAQKESLYKSYHYLSQVHSIGAGLIDKYYSTPIGLRIDHDYEDIEQLKRKIKEIVL
jgi:dTDP-4-amino-4,6-dideoxygalactose transaminase